MNEPQRIDQTEFGQLGNCQSACLAMLLGVPLETVPNFSKIAEEKGDNAAYAAQSAWLLERGWTIVTVVPWQALPWPPKHGFYIAGGASPRGYRHAVLFKDGALWHDPHPSHAGLVGDIQDVDLLIPLEPWK